MNNDPPKALIKPLDPMTERTIRCVCAAANALGINVLLCGATARVLVLEHIHGCEPERQTHDIDFAFAVNDWAQHHALAQSLTATGLWQRGKHLHQLLPSQMNGGVYPLDLVPYGAIENERGEISWPPKQAFAMSVLGFAEADRYAMRVAVAQDLVITVVDIVSIAMLKLIAWHDRKLEPDPRRKHAQDFALMIKNYGEFEFRKDRFYTEAPSVFERADGDVCLVGAWLLGHDVGDRVAARTRDKLQSVFAVKNQLLGDIQATSYFVSTARAEEILGYFVEGFQATQT